MARSIQNTIKDIWTSKMRSLLTIFGIVVGIASVTIMVSIGESSQEYIEQNLTNQMDENVLIATMGDEDAGLFSSLSALLGSFTEQDYEILKELQEQRQDFIISRLGKEEMTIEYTGVKYSTLALIVDPEYHDILNFTLLDGSTFSTINKKLNSQKILLGRDLNKSIFTVQNPIGQKLTLNGKEYIVMGINENATSSQFTQGMNLSNIDFESYEETFGKKVSITSLIIRVSDVSKLEEIKKDIVTVLRVSRGIDFNEEADFMVQTQEDVLETTALITTALNIFITVISSISLFVGGVGIMNIMLVSVKERIKEFGLRKAIGATNKDIMWQIISESIIFSIVGAVIGSLFGNIAALFIQSVAGLPLLVSVNAIISSIIVSNLVGVIFGFYPALTAAKLSPIEALRAD